MDGFEWDPAKAAANLAKHKVDFADAALSLEDLRALTISDPDATRRGEVHHFGRGPNGTNSDHGLQLLRGQSAHHFIAQGQPR